MSDFIKKLVTAGLIMSAAFYAGKLHERRNQLQTNTQKIEQKTEFLKAQDYFAKREGFNFDTTYVKENTKVRVHYEVGIRGRETLSINNYDTADAFNSKYQVYLLKENPPGTISYLSLNDELTEIAHSLSNNNNKISHNFASDSIAKEQLDLYNLVLEQKKEEFGINKKLDEYITKKIGEAKF